MVSDAELAQRLTAILQSADLSTTTTTTIRQRLESELAVDLSTKKAFVRQHIDAYLQQQQQSEADVADGSDGQDGCEEEEADVDADAEVEAEEDEDAEDQVGRGEQDEEAAEEDEKPTRASRRSIQSEPDSKRSKAKIDKAIKKSLPKEKKKRTGGAGGLNKVCGLSPELQVIIGEPALPRTQVVKNLWVYIRENKLQDPENKQKIICNEALRGLFGTDSTDMFQMNKLLSKHIWPLDTSKSEDGDAQPKPKKIKKEQSSGKGKSGFLSPRPISAKLSNFFGTGETEAPRADVVRRIWDYIKHNGLQDPADKRNILCDEKLEELFGCKTFVGFEMTKLLQEHFIKA